MGPVICQGSGDAAPGLLVAATGRESVQLIRCYSTTCQQGCVKAPAVWLVGELVGWSLTALSAWALIKMC